MIIFEFEFYSSDDDDKRKHAAEEQALLVGATIGNDFKEVATFNHLDKMKKN